MRAALRNQDKIKEVLGEESLFKIIESLKQGFLLWRDRIEDIIEDKGLTYPIIELPDSDMLCDKIVFYVIKKKYDVYTVAFKEFKKEEDGFLLR